MNTPGPVNPISNNYQRGMSDARNRFYDVKESTPSPGSWFLEAERTEDKCHAYVSSSDHGALAVVVVKMQDDANEAPRLLANARLIAAAPDLLEALQSLVEWSSAAEPHDYEEPPVFSAARAAIAKAAK